MRLKSIGSLVFLVLISLVSYATGQERYFYKGRNFGSEALFNPLNFILDSCYGIKQM
jgi:hypothetical protein